jgi:hypothetical protein
MESAEVTRLLLMYVILPIWLVAGFADYLCHRYANIQITSGWKESLLPLLQLAEMAIPVLAGLFLEITSGVVALMMVALALHQLTAMWDVRYAAQKREITPIEQHVHSVLEMVPFAGFALILIIHWDAFAGLIGTANPDFSLRWKADPLPWAYTTTILLLTASFELLPYLEELWRGLRHRTRSGA